MSAPKDGGTAFPITRMDEPYREGMSLRDYFAAAALQGLIASDVYRKDQGSQKKVAEISYILADAMLEARKQ